MNLKSQLAGQGEAKTAKHRSQRSAGISVNIKNERAVQLIYELAALKGISLVDAVSESVQEKLDREKVEQERASSRAGMADRLMAIAERTAPLMRGTPPSTEIFDDLYDEMGLPK